MIKTAVYIRTSTTEQNPQNQLNDCLSIIDNEYEIFEEQQSAWKDTRDRPQFEELKKCIRSGKIKKLIVWDVDRLYRNRKKLVEFFEFVRVYGCVIVSYRQQFLQELAKIPEPWNEIMYNMMVQIYGHLSQEESDKKSSRVKASVRKDKKGRTISHRGNKWGRPRVDVNVYKVKQMANSGLSQRQIAKELGISVGKVNSIINEN